MNRHLKRQTYQEKEALNRPGEVQLSFQDPRGPCRGACSDCQGRELEADCFKILMHMHERRLLPKQ